MAERVSGEPAEGEAMTEGETRGAIFTRSVGKQTAISDKHRCRKDHRYVVSSCPLSLTQAKRERGAPRGGSPGPPSRAAGRRRKKTARNVNCFTSDRNSNSDDKAVP
jgi:hypothetical protein